MTFEEHKEFPVNSSSLKEVRSFAREVLAKDPLFKSTSDDVVLALAEAAQNIKPRAVDDIKPGGLGTFFIGQIMDEVTFKTSASDWVNHLIMTKNY